MKKIYVAKGCYVNEDGREDWYEIGYFEKKSDAKKACKGKYSGWSKNEDGKVEERTIYENFEEFELMDLCKKYYRKLQEIKRIEKAEELKKSKHHKNEEKSL